MFHSSLPGRAPSVQPSTMAGRRPSQPPQTSSTVIPKAIPDNKIPHALELYNKYLLELHTQESDSSQYHGPSTSHSQTSRTSSREQRTPSIITSAYAAESLVSFADNDLSPIGRGKGKADPISFDGKVVKQRKRKQLTPVGRAKAALIRYLGSCESCHGRSVSCPLEHHDIETLNIARKAGRSTEMQQQPSSSSTSNSARLNPARSPAVQDNATTSQSNALFGVGQSFGESATNIPDITTAIQDFNQAIPMPDVRSSTTAIQNFKQEIPILPGIAAFPDLNQEIPVPPSAQYIPSDHHILPGFFNQPTSQNGGMFILGIWATTSYTCNFPDCLHMLNDAEELQTHWEETHMQFERINPPHRFQCSSCNFLNDIFDGPCQDCGRRTIQTQVCGQLLPLPWDQQYPPDSQAVLDDEHSSPLFTPFSSEDYAVLNPGYGRGPNPNGYQNNDMGMYTDMDFDTGGSYQGPSTQPDSSNGPSYSNADFNEFNNFSHHAPGSIRRRASMYFCKALRFSYLEARRNYAHPKLFVCTIISFLLFAITLAIQTHDWIFSKFREVLEGVAGHNMPMIGFIGALLSFVTCYSWKCVSGQRDGKVDKIKQNPCTKCPLRPWTAVYFSSFRCARWEEETRGVAMA